MKSYKVELNLNNKQTSQCKKHCDAARFAYNWALAFRMKAYQENKLALNYYKINPIFNELKRTEKKWLYEVSKCVTQEAIRDLDKAYNNFFRKVKANKTSKKKIKVGFPKFKSRKKCKYSFRLTGPIKIFSGKIQLPKLGKLRIYEKNYIPLDAKVLSATITKHSDKWFVSVLVQEPSDKTEKEISSTKLIINEPKIVGIDLGIKSLAVLSDGQVIENPKTLYKHAKKLRKCHKNLSRKKKGSWNREKAKKKLNREHFRVSQIRKDHIEKVTTAIIKQFNVIGLETLNVQGMMRNHHLAKAIQDASWGFFKRKLIEKASRNKVMIVAADRFYPSSKTCSKCGVVKETLDLSERTFFCEDCGFSLDRDLNAAINLRQVAQSSWETLNVCGDEVRLSLIGERLSEKQDSEQELG